MKHVNHYKLEKDIYLADTPVNNLWILDVRVIKPNNKEKLMKTKAIHTAEHIASDNKPLYIDGKEGCKAGVVYNIEELKELLNKC